jgi:hypothetical protein
MRARQASLREEVGALGDLDQALAAVAFLAA